MRDPVIAADGFTYERSALEAWFAKSRRSPKVRFSLLAGVVRKKKKRRSSLAQSQRSYYRIVCLRPFSFFSPNASTVCSLALLLVRNSCMCANAQRGLTNATPPAIPPCVPNPFLTPRATQTNVELATKDLIPNRALKALIGDYRARGS